MNSAVFSLSHSRGRKRVVQASAGWPRIAIDTGGSRNANAPTTSQNQGTVILFTPMVGGTLNFVSVFFTTATSSPTAIGYLMSTSGGVPTGAKYAGALANSNTATISNAFVKFDLTAGGGGSGAVTVTAGTQYALVIDEQAVGGSYVAGYSSTESIKGWGMLYAATIANPVQNSVFVWKNYALPYVHLGYASGQEVCKMGAGSTSAGNITLFGDPANASTGRFAGIQITPACDIMLDQVDVSCRFTGTAATANALELRIYNALTAGGLVRTSSNTISATNDLTTAGTNRYQSFTMTPYLLRQGVTYWLLACQTGTGGSSDSANHLQLDGSVGGNYVTAAAPPQTAAQNQQHGIVSMSSTTGLANVAYNSTTGHEMILWGVPWRR